MGVKLDPLPSLYGKVIRKNTGFGFIREDQSRRDVFFHKNELNGIDFDSLAVGDRVVFCIAEDYRNPGRQLAIDVCLDEAR